MRVIEIRTGRFKKDAGRLRARSTIIVWLCEDVTQHPLEIHDAQTTPNHHHCITIVVIAPMHCLHIIRRQCIEHHIFRTTFRGRKPVRAKYCPIPRASGFTFTHRAARSPFVPYNLTIMLKTDVQSR